MKRRDLLMIMLVCLGTGLSSVTRSGEPVNDKLALPPDFDATLAKLLSKPKFEPDNTYTGYFPEEHRSAAAQLVNDLITRLRARLPSEPSRNYLKQQINDTYAWFELSDTEDRERCAIYLEAILQAAGLPPAESRIDAWLNPFDPATFASHPHLED